MSGLVWISKAPSDSSLEDGFTKSDLQLDGNERLIELSKSARKGESISASDLPSEIWGEVGPYRAHHFPNYWPEITLFSGMWIISGKVAQILRAFDMGGGVIAPVRRFEKNHVTPVPGEWFCWNVGNLKESLLPGQSKALLPAGGSKWLGSRVNDHDVKCTAVATAGPDVWYDPQLRGVLFLSAALGQALIDADVATQKAGFGQLVIGDVIDA